MILAILMAVWFGFKAHKARRSIAAWAVGGGLFTLALANVIAYTFVYLMTGTFRPAQMTIEMHFAGVLAMFVALVVAMVVGQLVLKPPAPPKVEEPPLELPPETPE